MFLLFCSIWANAQKDCCEAFDLIGGGVSNVTLNTAGSAKLDNVSACSCLAGEGGSWWLAFSATTSGTFEIIIEPIFQPGPNFDFALWADLCPCGNGGAQIPFAVSCNNVDGAGPTGISDKPEVTFGSPATPQFSPTVTLDAGRNYYLLVSNVEDTGVGFSLRTAGTAGIGPKILDDFGLSISGPSTVCTGGTAVFTASSQASPLQTFHGWEILQTGYQTATGQNPQVELQFPGPGTYDVCVTVFNDEIGCGNSAPQCTSITVEDLPYPAGYESDIICTNNYYVTPNGEVFFTGGTYDVTYQSWQGCDSIIRLTLDQKPSPYVVLTKTVCPGYCVEFNNQTICDDGYYEKIDPSFYGCDSTTALNLIVLPVKTNITGLDTIDCYTPSITLNSNTSVYANNPKYTWRLGNNIVGTNPTLTINTGGTYSLTIKSNIGLDTCTDVATVVVIQDTNPPQNLVASGGTINCNSSQVTLNATTTTPNVTYQWTGPNGFNSNLPNPTTTVPGSYSLTVTGRNGCTKTATVSVMEDKVLPNAIANVANTLNCNNSSVVLNGAGSSTGPQYSYTWSTTNGSINGNPNSQSSSANAAGTYVLTVTNTTNFCTRTASTTVIQRPPVVAAVASSNNISCFGGQNGAVSINVSGGDGTYTYLWSNGATSASQNGLGNGAYSVVVTDGEGCTASQAITLTQPNILLANAVSTAQTQMGVDDGTVTAAPTGGVPNYNYVWTNESGSNVGNNATISGLAPGNYSVVVTDANGCTAVQAVTVMEVSCAVVVNITENDASCFGETDGSATINLDNAAPPFTINWSNGAVGQTAPNLAAGTYFVTAVDAFGCEVVATAIIEQPLEFTANAIADNISCNGQNDGSATVNTNGGTGQLSILWSTNATTSSISNLSGGTYSVSVTDEIGCIAVSEVNVVEPAQLDIDVDDTEASCGASNGQLTVMVTGGTPNFTLVWENGETTPTITGLAADYYSLSVTDANDCTESFEIYLGVDDDVPPTILGNDITLELDANGQATIQPSDVDNGSTDNCEITAYNLGQLSFDCSDLGDNSVVYSITDAGLNMATANIIVTVLDNTAPVLNLQNTTLVIGATGSATLTPALINNGSTDNCGITNWVFSQSSFDCNDVGENTVEVTASDASGNMVSGTVVVTVSETTAPTINCPANLALPSCTSVAVFDVTASDNCVGPVTLVQTAGLPSGSSFPAGATTVSFSATDISGNTSNCSFIVTASPDMELNVTSVNVDCNGDDTGSATANPNAGTPPFTYIWSNGATSQTAPNLVAGAYTVSVTDAGGCSATQSVTITQPPVLSTALVNIINATVNQADGSIDVNVTGGVQPYTYNWVNSAGVSIGNTQDISGLGKGTYTLSVTDANGCVSLSGYTIQETTGTKEEELGRHIMLYPNPTTGKVTLEIDLPNIGNVMVSAFDVTGRNVLPQSTVGSKHSLDFSALPSGVYMLKIVIGETSLSKRLVVTK